MDVQLTNLKPQAFWRHFAEICSIPHPSGHEAALARRIVERAAEHGLKSRIDAAGNVRVDRPAAPGCAQRPRTIIQAHLDMVPQSVPGLAFDFKTMPIKPRVSDGWIVTDGTTLGADDGAGVALALAMLFDDQLQTGPLAGLFTVAEEIGLVGARTIDPAFLDGDNLLNLDGGDEHLFCIGCAGSGRLEIDFEVVPDPAVAGDGVEICLSGLRGGHSGSNINDRRGNALIYLARFIASEPAVRIGALDGGSVENAIPRDALARGVTGASVAALRERAGRFARELASEFDAPEKFQITVSAAARPAALWRPDFQSRLLQAVTTTPNGALAFSKEFDCVRTSSNLAAVHSSAGRLVILTSQRSLDDEERAALTEKIAAHFAASGAAVRRGAAYPGWQPRPDSALLKQAREVKREISGVMPKIYVTHSGLESGIFCRLNPKLDIIAFMPTAKDIHSPSERLDIGSVQRVYDFLRRLLEAL